MEFTPIETQEELDAIVQKRLAREREKLRNEFKEKYSDYDDLVAKAKAYDDAKEADKSELQKAQELIASLEADKRNREEADRIAAIRERIAKEKGVPADLLSGKDEEEITAFADRISEYAKTIVPPAAQDPTPGSFSGKGTGDDDMRGFAAALLGNS